MSDQLLVGLTPLAFVSCVIVHFKWAIRFHEVRVSLNMVLITDLVTVKRLAKKLLIFAGRLKEIFDGLRNRWAQVSLSQILN